MIRMSEAMRAANQERIDWLFEQMGKLAIAAATGTAKTPQAVECEASQSGGAAASPKGNRR